MTEIESQNLEKYNLTRTELVILQKLAEAWNEFMSLKETDQDVISEFRRSIHSCQCLIGTRVAMRVDPDIWVAKEHTTQIRSVVAGKK